LRAGTTIKQLLVKTNKLSQILQVIILSIDKLTLYRTRIDQCLKTRAEEA